MLRIFADLGFRWKMALPILLLATLLRRPQRIFSRSELMELVWGGAPHTSDRTVDAHVKLLRAKLREAGAGAELIQTHRNMGYSLHI